MPAPLTTALAGLIHEIIAAVGGIDVSVFPELWSSSGAYGSKAPQRLTDRQWEGLNGIYGHQHVPNNTHWDPGAFDIKAFVKLLGRDSAGSGAIQAGTPSPPLTDWPLLFEEGDRDEQVQIIRGVLLSLGYGNFAPSDLYNPKVAEAVTALQKAERITVDGIWGPQTHSHARARLDTPTLATKRRTHHHEGGCAMGISFATFNLENLQLADAATYPGTAPVTPAQSARKCEWTATQIAEIDADVIGFHELWDEQALQQVFAHPLLANQNYQLVTSGQTGTINNALAVRPHIARTHTMWVGEFPADVSLNSKDQNIKLTVKSFGRKVLRSSCGQAKRGPGNRTTLW